MDHPGRDDRSAEAYYVLIDNGDHVERRVRRRRRFASQEDVVDPWSYAAKRGQGTIRLSPIEYRLLHFLASRPNQALTDRRIADAISTARHRITPDSLRGYIHSLRGQLGFYSDFIQSVPYIGYRFTG